MSAAAMNDVRVTIEGHVGIAETCRAPNNYFDMALIAALAGAFERFDADDQVRCILLCAEGRNFCAGADFSNPARDTVGSREGGHLYQQAVRLFRTEKPMVAEVQGAAVGGGLGLALVADSALPRRSRALRQTSTASASTRASASASRCRAWSGSRRRHCCSTQAAASGEEAKPSGWWTCWRHRTSCVVPPWRWPPRSPTPHRSR